MTVKKMKIGPGKLELNAPFSASVTTTLDSAVVTAAVGTFLSTDVGAAIAGTGIPGGATILSVESSSSVTLSANATASGTVTATVTPAGGTTAFSCQITSAVVAWSDDAEDDLAVLCGDEEPGEITWSATLSGDMVQDPDVLVPWTWTHKGEKFRSVFIPSTLAGKQVVGVLVVKPLDFGGEVQSTASSGFEWEYVGEPSMSAIPI